MNSNFYQKYKKEILKYKNKTQKIFIHMEFYFSYTFVRSYAPSLYHTG